MLLSTFCLDQINHVCESIRTEEFPFSSLSMLIKSMFLRHRRDFRRLSSSSNKNLTKEIKREQRSQGD